MLGRRILQCSYSIRATTLKFLKLVTYHNKGSTTRSGYTYNLDQKKLTSILRCTKLCCKQTDTIQMSSEMNLESVSKAIILFKHVLSIRQSLGGCIYQSLLLLIISLSHKRLNNEKGISYDCMYIH